MSFSDSKKNLSQKEPPSIKNNLPAVWDLVKKDMEDRDKMGEKKHGKRLQPHNGRDVLVDAYQEALDLVVYLRQAIYEREEKAYNENENGLLPSCKFCGSRDIRLLEDSQYTPRHKICPVWLICCNNCGKTLSLEQKEF